MSEQDKAAAGIASRAENEALEHTREPGSVTTRRDATDLGVPMLPGDGKEVQGPEDALGAGPKRGDYRERIGPSNYHPTIVVPIEEPEPDGPKVQVVAQRPHADDIGDVPGKGGVSTAEAVAFTQGGPEAAQAAASGRRSGSRETPATKGPTGPSGSSTR